MSHACAFSSAGKCGQKARTVSMRGLLVSPLRILFSVVYGTLLAVESCCNLAALRPFKRALIWSAEGNGVVFMAAEHTASGMVLQP